MRSFIDGYDLYQQARKLGACKEGLNWVYNRGGLSKEDLIRSMPWPYRKWCIDWGFMEFFTSGLLKSRALKEFTLRSCIMSNPEFFRERIQEFGPLLQTHWGFSDIWLALLKASEAYHAYLPCEELTPTLTAIILNRYPNLFCRLPGRYRIGRGTVAEIARNHPWLLKVRCFSPYQLHWVE